MAFWMEVALKVVIVEFSGLAATAVVISVTMVITSAQVAAAARELEVELARLSTLVLAASIPAEFSVRVFAEARRSAFEVAQEDIAFIPSSSACLQAENSVLQFFSCAVTAFWSSLSLQPLMVVTRAVKLSLLQQSQASVPLSFIIWHLSTIPLNVIF